MEQGYIGAEDVKAELHEEVKASPFAFIRAYLPLGLIESVRSKLQAGWQDYMLYLRPLVVILSFLAGFLSGKRWISSQGYLRPGMATIERVLLSRHGQPIFIASIVTFALTGALLKMAKAV